MGSLDFDKLLLEMDLLSNDGSIQKLTYINDEEEK